MCVEARRLTPWWLKRGSFPKEGYVLAFHRVELHVPHIFLHFNQVLCLWCSLSLQYKMCHNVICKNLHSGGNAVQEVIDVK